MIYFRVLALAISVSILFSLSAGTEQIQPTSPITNESFLDNLIIFAREQNQFKNLKFNQDEKEFIRLVQAGQNPKILFIGCSDSRVVPGLILSTRPGDLFVLRTAGNFVTPFQFQPLDGLASTLQYAVEVLGVSHIIVCGHSHCGAIQGLFKDLPSQLKLLKQWLSHLGEKTKRLTLAVAKPNTSPEELYSAAEKISLLFQLENLLTYPFIRKKVEEDVLDLHAWYYKIELGELYYYDTKRFGFFSLKDMK